MKNPNSVQGARAFRVTSTATFASPVDATSRLISATQNEMRFRWCSLSNSVQPVSIRKGCIEHV